MSLRRMRVCEACGVAGEEGACGSPSYVHAISITAISLPVGVELNCVLKTALDGTHLDGTHDICPACLWRVLGHAVKMHSQTT